MIMTVSVWNNEAQVSFIRTFQIPEFSYFDFGLSSNPMNPAQRPSNFNCTSNTYWRPDLNVCVPNLVYQIQSLEKVIFNLSLLHFRPC